MEGEKGSIIRRRGGKKPIRKTILKIGNEGETKIFKEMCYLFEAPQLFGLDLLTHFRESSCSEKLSNLFKFITNKYLGSLSHETQGRLTVNSDPGGMQQALIFLSAACPMV